MEEGNKLRLGLLAFPPEIWCSITDYLYGEHIGRLKLTGDKLLWSKLSLPRAVKRMELGFDGIDFKCWPAFINELPSLESLDIFAFSSIVWDNMKPNLTMMPKTLRKLKLTIEEEFEFYHKDDDQMPYPINQYLPYLESLETEMSINDVSNWHAYLPESLTSLSITAWQFDIPLPPSLTNLKVRRLRRGRGKPSTVPPQLVIFECFNIHKFPELLGALPSSLRNFSMGSMDDNGMKPKELAKLPKELEELEICFNSTISSLPPSPSLLSWPPSLTTLLVNILPMKLWKWLPQTLLSLRIDDIPLSDLIPAFPADPSLFKLGKCCFEDLPQSLTALKADFQDPTLISFYGAENANTEAWSHETAKSLMFPPKLEKLRMANGQLTVEAAKQIPRSVTELSLLLLDSHISEALPRGLKHLLPKGVIMSLELLKHLPKQLVFLNLPLVQDDASYVLESTGEVHEYGELVKANEAKYGHKVLNNDHLFWQGEYALPTELEHLSLTGHSYVDDGIARNFPKKVNFLELESATHITDLSIPLFSRYLTILDLASASDVTGKSFQHLPKSLWYLSLSKSEDIYNEDIQHLPKTLEYINMSSAIHLTNECVKYWPRSLEDLILHQNRNISPEAFLEFPPRIRRPTSYKTFECATWCIKHGAVEKDNTFA